MREIGRGGMGAVWLGRDERLGRDVALKRIGVLPGADSTDLARAEREAHLAARLHHPHVVSVFDVVADESGDGRWLVMEHVDGPDCGRLVREHGALAPDDAARVLRQVADALRTAHEAGIVHRDVKPSNILLDRNGQAKLTDFGIARLGSDPSLTQTGMVTGSPTYLAPEIASGARGDEAADVWSLGATAYHLLTGRPPYETGDALSTIYRVVQDDPPRADVGWLTPLLEGTLVKDPQQRWTMAEVQDFVRDRREPDGWAPPAAVVPAPATREETLATSVVPLGRRRRPVRSALLVLLVALLVVGGFVLGRQLTDSSGDPPAASPSASASPTPTPTPSESESADPGPTAEGMEAFIRDYVRAVGDDPAVSWQMLTPKFQTESGGFDTYRAFWDDATNGRVLSISADPESLVVSYQVRFDNFDNGPGPTVLQLRYEGDGQYLIDGETSEGFTPAG